MLPVFEARPFRGMLGSFKHALGVNDGAIDGKSLSVSVIVQKVYSTR